MTPSPIMFSMPVCDNTYTSSKMGALELVRVICEQAELRKRFHGCRSPLTARRHCLAAGILGLWLSPLNPFAATFPGNTDKKRGI